MDISLLRDKIKRKWIPIFLGLIIAFVIVITEVFRVPVAYPLIDRVNNFIYDHMVGLYLQPHKPQVATIIIDIDDESVQKEGRWPWPRNKLALLLSKLQEAGVVVAAFDIVMAEAEVNNAISLKNKLTAMKGAFPEYPESLPDLLNKMAPIVDNDRSLATVMQDFDTVLGFLFHNIPIPNQGVLPTPLKNKNGEPIDASKWTIYRFDGYKGSFPTLISAAKSSGFVSNIPDADGVIRSALLVANYDNRLYPSLALATAMRYLLVSDLKLMTHTENGQQRLYGIDLNGTFIPTNAKGQMIVPFWGPPLTLDYYSATDVLQGKVGSSELEGAIVVIGSSMVLTSDLHKTPVAKLFPGVEIVGNIISSIVSQQTPSQVTWVNVQWIFSLIIGILLACALPFLNPFLMLFIVFIIILIIIGSSFVLFATHNQYLPVAPPLLIITILCIINYTYEFVVTKRQRQKIKDLFGQYVPQDYVKEIIDSPNDFNMEGKTKEMTVLFSDIRNFTNTSEPLDASSVKRLLNTFFTPMTEIIFKNHGVIDKYVGDMVVAFWGAPLEDTNHAEHAVRAALEVFNKLPEINATMRENDLPELNIGVGLGTGLMNVGDMGSEFRRAYTVLGDTVNLASRLESLTKFYQVNILVNEENREGQDAILWRNVDKVAVKGRKTAVSVFQPLGLVADASPQLIAEINDYEEAIEAYFKQDWLNSEKIFTNLKNSNPNLYLLDMYLERIKQFKEAPPPDGWDGVFIHHNK